MAIFYIVYVKIYKVLYMLTPATKTNDVHKELETFQELTKIFCCQRVLRWTKPKILIEINWY